MSRARQTDFRIGPLGGGATIYPYQLAFGVSLRFWRCLYAPTIRVHLGPFKVYLYVAFRVPPSHGDGE